MPNEVIATPDAPSVPSGRILVPIAMVAVVG
jgi:hypothetical protein